MRLSAPNLTGPRRARRVTILLAAVVSILFAVCACADEQIHARQLNDLQTMRRQQALFESVTLERRWTVDRLTQTTARLP